MNYMHEHTHARACVCVCVCVCVFCFLNKVHQPKPHSQRYTKHKPTKSALSMSQPVLRLRSIKQHGSHGIHFAGPGADGPLVALTVWPIAETSPGLVRMVHLLSS